MAVSAVDFGTKYCMLHASCAYFIIHTCSQLDVNSILLYMDTACVQTKSTLNVCAFRCDEKVSSISTVSVWGDCWGNIFFIVPLRACLGYVSVGVRVCFFFPPCCSQLRIGKYNSFYSEPRTTPTLIYISADSCPHTHTFTLTQQQRRRTSVMYFFFLFSFCPFA